ncbi:hypothetical protein ACOME3_005249 [Neoechinorhynchus agilis]
MMMKTTMYMILIILQTIVPVGFTYTCSVIPQMVGTIFEQLDKCPNGTETLVIEGFAWSDIPQNVAERFSLDTIEYVNSPPSHGGNFNFSGFDSLKSLRLSNVGIRSLEFYLPSTLEALDISNNKIRVLSPSIALKAKNIFYLNAFDNQIESLESFKLFSNLSVLVVVSNKISSISIDFSMDFLRLVQLWIYNNPIKSLTFTVGEKYLMDQTHLSRLLSLSEIHFRSSAYDHVIPVKQGASSALVELSLSYLGPIEDVLNQTRKLDNLVCLEVFDVDRIIQQTEPLFVGSVSVLRISSNHFEKIPSFARNNLTELSIWSDFEVIDDAFMGIEIGNKSVFPRLASVYLHLATYNLSEEYLNQLPSNLVLYS